MKKRRKGNTQQPFPVITLGFGAWGEIIFKTTLFQWRGTRHQTKFQSSMCITIHQIMSIIIHQIRWLLTFMAYLLKFSCITYTSHRADMPHLYLSQSLGTKLFILLLESLVGGRLFCMALPFSQFILLHDKSRNVALSDFLCIYTRRWVLLWSK